MHVGETITPIYIVTHPIHTYDLVLQYIRVDIVICIFLKEHYDYVQIKLTVKYM